MDQYIGKMLDNRYEILERIGTGGMAVVYKAKCHRLNRLVAIKILKSDLAQDEDFRRRFNAESQAVAQLSHPNIVSVYDVSRGGDTEYIVMELIDGITLKQYMEKRGQLNWRESLHFITQIMRGLSHAHSRGIVHRDIKPQNIMVLRDGSVKVADFGIACLENSAQTLTQEALGSVHYISPEQARGDRIDARSDLYSAGVVLYEMLTNRLPFEGDSAVSVAIQHLSSIPLAPREINPEIPEPLELICMKAMAPDLDRRYASADAMIEDLESFRKNPGISLDYTIADLRPDLEDEPTRLIRTGGYGASSTGTRHNTSRNFRETEREPERRESGRGRQALLVSGGVIVGVLLIFLLFRFIWGSFGAQQNQSYTVPDVRGYTVEEAEQLDGVKDIFEIKKAGEKPSDQYEAGQIMEQDPEKGDTKKSDLVITVYVSSGTETGEMLNVVNQEDRAAQIMLKNLIDQLNLTIDDSEQQFSSEYTAGYVISTDPIAGATLKEGDTIKLVISKGPEITKVTVPPFIGMDIEQAKKSLDGLKLGTVTPVDSDKPGGQILTQSIDATTEVDSGTSIDFTVSSGLAPSTSSVTESYPLPNDGRQTVHVVIKQDGTTVYDDTVDCSMGGTLSHTFTGSGNSSVVVYYDGVATYSEVLTFN